MVPEPVSEPVPEPNAVFSYAQFNIEALCRLASKLRNGQTCTCNQKQRPETGSFNWVVKVEFNDGVEWVMRSPRAPDWGHDAVQAAKTNTALLASEAATLLYLRAHSTIPVPQVYAYSASNDNDIGIPYILMAKAQGLPLASVWQNTDAEVPFLSDEQKAKIISQLGSITFQLSRMTFEHGGSLLEENGNFKTGPCLSRGLTEYDRDKLEELSRGPFLTEKAFYGAHVAAFIEHVQYGYLRHHCFFAPIPSRRDYGGYEEFKEASDWWSDFVSFQDKINSSENATDYVIAGDAITEMLPLLTDGGETGSPINHAQQFYLHHPDLSVHNIYVDDDLNITCLIDWQSCSTVPLSTLLTPPGLPQSRYELPPSLREAFNDGFSSALKCAGEFNEADTDALLRILRHGRPFWLLDRFLALNCLDDYYLFEELWKQVNPGGPDVLSFCRERQSSPHYISLHSELAGEELTREEIAKIEKYYFNNNAYKLAVARKLTFVSQWSTRYRDTSSKNIRRNGSVFVADRKLWRWMFSCLKGQ